MLIFENKFEEYGRNGVAKNLEELGDAFASCNLYRDAASSYIKALYLYDNQNITRKIWNKAGNAYLKLDRADDAMSCFQSGREVELKQHNDFQDASINIKVDFSALSSFFRDAGDKFSSGFIQRYDLAMTAYISAIDCCKNADNIKDREAFEANLWEKLGNACFCDKKYTSAIECSSILLDIDKENSFAKQLQEKALEKQKEQERTRIPLSKLSLRAENQNQIDTSLYSSRKFALLSTADLAESVEQIGSKDAFRPSVEQPVKENKNEKQEEKIELADDSKFYSNRNPFRKSKRKWAVKPVEPVEDAQIAQIFAKPKTHQSKRNRPKQADDLSDTLSFEEFSRSVSSNSRACSSSLSQAKPAGPKTHKNFRKYKKI